jgi:opacity protein-like surface antigen
MRKILLASAALALLGGNAMAADVTVTTTVAQACSVSADPSVILPANGSSVVGAYSYQCNFTGSTADLTWSSANGGVDADGVGGDPAHDYTIATSLGGSGSASAGLSETNVATTANTASPQTFTLALVAPIIVAGTYTDTLTVNIAP